MITNEAEAQAWIRTLPECDDQAMARLDLLAQLLAAENTLQNLVSAQSLQHLWQRHIADSAQLLLHVPRETGAWLDLGTGAGFPGLVIAACRPHQPIVLVESRSRRVAWLKQAARAMDLTNVEVAGQRLEHVETFSATVISARAFAPLDRLLAISARFSSPDTVWLLPKGRSAVNELEGLRGWEHSFHVQQSLTDPAAGLIVGRLVGLQGGKRARNQ